MSIAFKDDKPVNTSKSKANTTAKKRNIREELEKRYMPRHSHIGYIITIIVLSLALVGGLIGMFFFAKGLGWNEAAEKVGQEQYQKGFEEGKQDGSQSSWFIGYDQGYKVGFEAARNCAQKILNGQLHASIYTCYKN